MLEEALSELLKECGREDPKTPARAAKALRWLTRQEDWAQHIAVFPAKHRDVVEISGLGFACLCEHHLLPFHGRATVCYTPRHYLIGASKPGRILRALASEPQTQEELTGAFADVLADAIDPDYLWVELEATHTCILARGLQEHASMMVTRANRP